MAYNITLSDGTTIVTIPDGAIFNTYSVPLIGQNTSAYGDDVAAAFLRSLENFAFSSPPDTNPNIPGSVKLTGQLWYDTSGTLKVYDGADWKPLLTPDGGLDDIAGDIVPAADSLYDIGTTSLRWAEGWFDNVQLGGTLTVEAAGTLDLNGDLITDGGSTVDLNGTITIDDATMDGRLTLQAASGSAASLRIPSGTSTSTTDGDMWFDGSNLKLVVGGTAQDIAIVGPSGGVTAFNTRSGAVTANALDYSDPLLADGHINAYPRKDSGSPAQTIHASAGIWTFDNRPAFNGGLSGSTSPFTVDSTQMVANLTAQYLFGDGAIRDGDYWATDAEVVKLTGTQNIDGDKTFTNKVRINSDDNQALRLIGSSTGNANQVYMSFYESNDSTEVLRIGDDSANGWNTIDSTTGNSLYIRVSGDPRMRFTTTDVEIYSSRSTVSPEVEVRDPTTGSQETTGMEVADYAGTRYNVGFNETPQITISSNVTLSEIHIGKFLTRTSATVTTVDLDPSTNIPIGGSAFIHNDNATGTLQIVQGAGATVEWLDGSGSITTGSRFLAYNGLATVRRKNTTGWQVWGMGLT